MDIMDDFKLISRTVIFRLGEINNIMIISFVKNVDSISLRRSDVDDHDGHSLVKNVYSIYWKETWNAENALQ